MTSINQKKLLTQSKVLPFSEDRKRRQFHELPPLAVELHWTSDCNYDCVHCSYGSRRQSKGRLMPETIQSVIDELVRLRVKAVYLSGGGEPTVVKGWSEYARQLLDGGVEIALITNGVALQKKHLPVLRHFNYIAVSVYSTDQNQYGAITESRFFDRQWEVPGLVKDGISQTVVGARCVINKINYQNVLNVYWRAKEAGYDYILFIPAVDYEGRGISLGHEEQAEVMALFRENIDQLDTSFTNVGDILEREMHHYTQQDYRKLFASPPLSCKSLEYRMNAFVNYCGGVWLCQPHIGNGKYQIGNLNNGHFSEIWNSLRHEEVAALLHEEFAAGRCENCRSIRFNNAMDIQEHTPMNLNNIDFDPFV